MTTNQALPGLLPAPVNQPSTTMTRQDNISTSTSLQSLSTAVNTTNPIQAQTAVPTPILPPPTQLNLRSESILSNILTNQNPNSQPTQSNQTQSVQTLQSGNMATDSNTSDNNQS